MRNHIKVDPIRSLEFENDIIEYENDFEEEYNSSFNTATLEDIKDILYELHEYFDEFEIEVVACPNLKRDPFNLKFGGLSKETYILEIHDPRYSFDLEMDPDPETGVVHNFPFCVGKNYFFSEQRPGMVLKIRAKGRKTNYNIITLIQNILHKRFSYKMGLGGVIVIKGGQLVEGYFKNNYSELICHNINCSSKIKISTGAIVNDPIIIGQHNGLFYTSDRYMFGFNSQFALNRFVNDVTPEETEYVGYFNIAEEVTHF